MSSFFKLFYSEVPEDLTVFGLKWNKCIPDFVNKKKNEKVGEKEKCRCPPVAYAVCYRQNLTSPTSTSEYRETIPADVNINGYLKKKKNVFFLLVFRSCLCCCVLVPGTLTFHFLTLEFAI